ncbi:MAG: cyclic nucleotide-binding domain-containing protein [Scytolyngbya sp. HA4215-MV1]|jgi:bacteriocin-type transport-associated protein|nr:cyclic nucleotide-binding domain-containing protein [Scytolyngbya sp. HA4215-MV1]
MKKVLFILGELSDDDIDWVIAIGKREEVAANTVLIQEGQPIDTLYVLLKGKLTVSTIASGGKEIAILTSGEIVGEMSFVDSRPPSATVKAIEPSLLLSLPRTELATKLKQDVGFASRFYRALAIFLSNRLRVTVSQLGYNALPPVGEDLPETGFSPETTDSIALARTRLDWLMRRLRGLEG